MSSWLMHLAMGNGAKLQAFCDCAFGKENQLWNRDIDRLAPDWLLSELSNRAAVPLARIRESTLASFEGRLFRKLHLSGQLRWILPLMVYHRKRLGYGLQFCPSCLSADQEPYFRCRWRVAFYTFCTTHKCMLQERCPECLSPVVFHRRELGRPRILNSKVLCLCSECDYDLRKAKPGPPTILESQSFRMFEEMLAELESGQDDPLHVCIEFTEVLHQICMLLVSGRPTLRLYDFVLSEMKVRHRALTKGRFPFEERALDERHFVIQLAMWLLANPADRLKQAWEAGAVRYNYLVKDMDSPPEAFAKIVAQFNRGRRVL